MNEKHAPDRFWSEAIAFLQAEPDVLPKTVGPRELQPFLPTMKSFEEPYDIAGVDRVVCHKGMIDSVPLHLLSAGFGRAAEAFSNEVFVAFNLSNSARSHVRAFEVSLIDRLSKDMPDGSNARLEPVVEGETLLRRPSPLRSGRARIVVALQSPTLLDIWAQSGAWSVEVAELGDHSGLQESTLLTVDPWNGDPGGVSATLVTTPLQLETARRTFPDAACVWVIHNGRPGMLPPELIEQVDGVITLSNTVLALQRTHHPELMGKPSWVIPPFYEASPIYRWAPNKAWAMKSRPSTRDAYDVELFGQLSSLLEARGVSFTVYGQDTPGGFLDEHAKAALRQRCTCYVSPLPPWAGFGLAQHEALAAGVPLAGLQWGDVGAELSTEYTALTGTLDDLCDQVDRLCKDEAYANRMSAIGLDYIRGSRAKRFMDDAVERFVAEVRPITRA